MAALKTTVLKCACAAIFASGYFAAAAGARGEEKATKPTTASGLVEFDCPNAPQGEMAELNLSDGMFKDLSGIGDATVAGIVEALNESAGAKSGEEDAQATAEQSEQVRQLVQLACQMVRGVHVQDYEAGGFDEKAVGQLVSYYDKKLRAANWETIAHISSGGETIEVCAVRDNGAIKGLFVVSADEDEILLVNVACDISPENMKKLTSAAAKCGLQAGMGNMIKEELRKLRPCIIATAVKAQ